jgi:TctA family transporter
MTGRWLAALLGASVTSLVIGIAVARSIGEATSLAVASGGFIAVCAWSILAPAAIAQRSAARAWAVITVALMLALVWTRLS